MSKKFNPFSDPPAKDLVSNETLKPCYIKLYEHLQQGNTINFVQARAIGVDQLDRRIAELRRTMTIYSREIRLSGARCLEYSLQPFI